MSSYADCISEVFIKPIRSVLAIDDEFPVFDQLIGGKQIEPNAQSLRLAKLLDFCRLKHPHWLVDVDDGKKLPTPVVPVDKLRQCNWLILDYKLDGENGGGTKAISVLRSLAGSNHFNLVVIYTTLEPSVVFNEVAVALSDLPSKINLDPRQRKDVEAFLDDSEPKILEGFRNSITPQVCSTLLRNNSTSLTEQHNATILRPFLVQLEEAGPEAKPLAQAILDYFILEVCRVNMSGDGYPLTLAPESAKKRWLKAGNIFVSIERKTTEADTLLESLKDALEEWKPSPNQLIVAKLRNEMEALGLDLEDRIVRDINLQAFWLHLLAEPNELEDAHHIGVLVERQTELLSDQLKPKVLDFAVRSIREGRNLGSPAEMIQRFFRVNISDKSVVQTGTISHNTHVSTKPVSGKNLTPGHVLELKEDAGSSFWVCLSPACDLEAGRKNGRDLKIRLKPWMPFTALKLHEIENSKEALKHASRGWVLFLDVNLQKRQFSYFPVKDQKADEKGSPVWEEFFAENEGRFPAGHVLNIARIKPLAEGPALPEFERLSAKIVAQLRSEYAINLTLRLTGHLSRVGLDYFGA